MFHASRELALAAFALGAAVLSLSHCAVTVDWRQRTTLLWVLIPLAGGVGTGLFKGEPPNMILFTLGGALALLSLMLFFPWGRRKELNRRKAAGETIGPKEYEPPSWVVWTMLVGVIAWACLSYFLYGG
ncbi:hypothetical protein A6A08_02860 [Nocardiopsis sp. TSRI0078]|uniref:hypothetical protein n=1 Tax=unclassified Nocardiopsis TaxID=2649073 RepID=UPI000938B020|nr:hypothetical protein [Nocardiopsis sp. TSRI0078]OKI23721.1 hypothetical protein A6A08_02860 [Nocardiopsis sp. TSRI0078]